MRIKLEDINEIFVKSKEIMNAVLKYVEDKYPNTPSLSVFLALLSIVKGSIDFFEEKGLPLELTLYKRFLADFIDNINPEARKLILDKLEEEREKQRKPVGIG